ncbi:MAG TPA: hypothetical protein VJ206_06975 [bacterium]|jgi:hypothetical protein|nr:hypothetical protein [bacterium]
MNTFTPLLFIETAALVEPVSVEVDRPRAVHPLATGFWRNDEYHRVVKIVETRYEYGETFFRVVTDRGCADLRRYRATDPRTMRTRVAWELCAEVEAIEIPRPR